MADALRILHMLSAPAAGGAEIFVKQLAIELRRLGHCPAIGFRHTAGQDGRSSAFERAFLDELDSAGVDYFFVGPTGRAALFANARRVRRFCRTAGVQIYHSHLKTGILLGMFLKIPRVYTHHTAPPRAPLWAYRIFNLLVDQYVGISESCGRLLQSYAQRPVAVVRNAVDTSRFKARVRAPATGSIVRCVAVGRISPPKNYELLVQALAAMPPAARKRLHVTIAGEGDAGAVRALERQIEHLGVKDCFSLIGNQLDVTGLLDSCDLFLMSSDREGFPISLLEATAAGLPFIATDVGGCSEMAALGENGMIVPAGDARQLADAIARLTDNPAEIARLSRAAIANSRKISIKEAAAQYLRIYSALLPAAGPAASRPARDLPATNPAVRSHRKPTGGTRRPPRRAASRSG